MQTLLDIISRARQGIANYFGGVSYLNYENGLDFFWSAGSGSFRFDEVKPEAGSDAMYIEDLNSVTRGAEFTLISYRDCTGEGTRYVIVDNTKEVSFAEDDD